MVGPVGVAPDTVEMMVAPVGLAPDTGPGRVSFVYCCCRHWQLQAPLRPLVSIEPRLKRVGSGGLSYQF